jgi:hypothetical protein
MWENSRWEDSLPWMKRMVWGGMAVGLVRFGSCCEGERRVYANSTGIVGSSGGDASEVMFTVSFTAWMRNGSVGPRIWIDHTAIVEEAKEGKGDALLENAATSIECLVVEK